MNLTRSDFGAEEAAMQAYFREGEAKAIALDNRGPLRLTSDGRLDPAIIDAYNRSGFYVFEGLFRGRELTELTAGLKDVLERLPVERNSPVDCKGRPALDVGYATPMVTWTKPLGDPLGGTGLLADRAPVKMIEGAAAAHVTKEVHYGILSPLQFSDAMLRVYGHPGLLAVAATIYGDDFTPFTETIVIKRPGEGGAFAWHQDGTTHWDSKTWNPGIHGFNFMVQFNRCTAANAVWFVPGSHAVGKVDIRKLVAQSGGNRLRDAVPLICNAGDVAINNRQVVHGSFPNTSDDERVSLTLGFLPRSSVAGVRTRTSSGNLVTYDAERIRKRAEVIGYAIDARRQRFPDEQPFTYRPHAETGERYPWNEGERGKLKNYQTNDLFI